MLKGGVEEVVDGDDISVPLDYGGFDVVGEWMSTGFSWHVLSWRAWSESAAATEASARDMAKDFMVIG